MKCPHCTVAVHIAFSENVVVINGVNTGWKYKTAKCPACDNLIFNVVRGEYSRPTAGIPTLKIKEEIMVWPRSVGRAQISQHVPAAIAQDYSESCQVLAISPKASAALSRRCLQAILNDKGYTGRDLAKQIDSLLANPQTPSALRDTVDAVRNFGNFSAHPITEQTTLQVIDVDPNEAEWCLDIIEEMFDYFYARPAAVAERKAQLNAKLASGGKPAAK